MPTAQSQPRVPWRSSRLLWLVVAVAAGAGCTAAEPYRSTQASSGFDGGGAGGSIISGTGGSGGFVPGDNGGVCAGPAAPGGGGVRGGRAPGAGRRRGGAGGEGRAG